MKRVLSVLLTLVMLMSLFAFSAFAADTPAETVLSREIIEMEDGYMVVTLSESVVNSRANVYYKFGSKTYSYYNASDVLQFTFTLHGDFAITTGVSVVCTYAYYDYTINASNWSLSTANTYPSGNKAYGSATFNYTLGSSTLSKSCTLVITCDGNGNLS